MASRLQEILQKSQPKTQPQKRSITTIVPMQKQGFSDLIEVGGRKGRFDFNQPPTFQQRVGGGKSPLFPFITEQGNIFRFRLEKNKQGGRWEEGKDFNTELSAIRRNPDLIQQFWGNSDIANFLNTAIPFGLNDESIKRGLGQFNTHRQESGD